ncbi:MAG: 16S rRNA (guanine(966)-N(2))-methyltransferase RsmD [Synechococcaceae cyanobacterium SM2_3_1]|nr:16S rRNA (guanine(966)-N(2))-methyltransferase RsmD [Synechococcaceae cyanobacterium SM2_3_1]
MRIGGNRRIKSLPGQSTRPTSGRVREALFNILQGQVADSRWLDICCGAGSIGAEALVRGAAEVVGIDNYPAACQITRQNWQQLAKDEQKIRVIQADAVRVLRQTIDLGPFNFIYLDPPYESDLYLHLWPLLASHLAAAGRIIVEHRHNRCLADGKQEFNLIDQRFYGESCLSFYQIPQEEDDNP